MSEWQPIETAPRDGTPVLVFIPAPYPEHDDPKMATAVYFGRKWGWEVWCLPAEWDGQVVDKSLVDAPTHWMPLPAPPEAATVAPKPEP